MIISHKHRYIFIKPFKVAGTSVQINLAKHCGLGDVVPPIGDFSDKWDSNCYSSKPRNFSGFTNHMAPEDIKKVIDPKIWDSYFKFTIIRNPWDALISEYFWQLKGPNKYPIIKLKKRLFINNIFNLEAYFYILKRAPLFLKSKLLGKNMQNSFELFIEALNKSRNNKFYFDSEGKPLCDFYIRYEHLDRDYGNICKRLGIPYEKLPLTKNKTRNKIKHYSQYYTPKTRDIVARKCALEIKNFAYSFKTES